MRCHYGTDVRSYFVLHSLSNTAREPHLFLYPELILLYIELTLFLKESTFPCIIYRKVRFILLLNNCDGKPGAVVHAYNPQIQVAEAGGSQSV